jgi:hypothetical protein
MKQQRGGQGPYWAVEPYDDDEDAPFPSILMYHVNYVILQ